MSNRRYTRRKEASRRRNAQDAAAGQDIGYIPPVADPDRRARAAASLRIFCETYLAAAFYNPWSEDQLMVIGRLETACLRGGLFAFAMPRYSGKTTLSRAAVLWAILNGHRRFVCLIAASSERAGELLESNKTILETNDLLAQDYPEACHPIRSLERMTNRQKGQKYGGSATYIVWGSGKVVLATIPGYPASGGIMTAAGMKGSDVRGQYHQLTTGEVIRPDLAIIDDPQTDDSAASRLEVRRRLKLLSGAVLGLAGPGRKIAVAMPCTVIMPDDVADQMLDREKHPEWQGERISLVRSFPKNEKRWTEYRRLRAESQRAGGTGRQATAYYAAHRRSMDAGARVPWPAFHDEDELSPIQHAMNLLYLSEETFWAEYQNKPRVPGADLTDALDPHEIAARLSGLPRRHLPLRTEHLTAYIDCQKEALYYTVVAWAEDFTGAVVDYGTWPGQGVAYYELRNLKSTLGKKYPRMSWEAALSTGLRDLTALLLDPNYMREDGALMRIERCLVDANWETERVHNMIRADRHADRLMPSHGRSIRASSTPMSEWRKHTGDQVGNHWIRPSLAGKRRLIRHVLIDTYYWKTFLASRLRTAEGDPSALVFFGTRPGEHAMIADHMVSESPVLNAAKGRTVEEWYLKTSRPENHFWDCLVGCCAAADMLGCRLIDSEPTGGVRLRERKVMSLRSQQRGRR